ncbi:hypothetical protein V3C99_009040 [Haemonchus contortus]|uniref:Recep_L_domain domain-containing protein n=1 Tax=Haemonchus contortus TaxID=6289 RepID=A0A7I4YMB1_HAECO
MWFQLLKGALASALVVVELMAPTAEDTQVVYPVNESYPINERTRECLFKGVNQYFSAFRDDCFFIYGRMVGDNYRVPIFYQIFNFTGCIIMAELDKLENIPLSSFMSLRANFKFCEYKYSLMVYGNKNLRRISLRKDMEIKKEEVFIRANEKLRREQVTNAPFDVDVGSPHDCTIKMALKRKDCTALVGDLKYPSDEDMREAWKRISKVYGTITIDDISDENLNILRNLTVDGWQPRVVRILNNHKLKNIAAVLDMKVTGPKPHFWFSNNPSICHSINVRKEIEVKVETKLQWNDSCMLRCKGGVMSADYLEKMVENCNSINGDLLIEGLKNLPPNIGKLAQIEQINGRLIVKKNSGVPDLSFLPNLEEIDTVDSDRKLPCLEVVGNENFTLKGLTGIRNIYGNVYVSTRRKSDVPAEVKQYLKQITVGTSTFVYDNVTQEGIILIARRSTKLRKLILKKRPKTAEVEAAAAISSKEATVKSSDGASKSIEGSRDI